MRESLERQRLPEKLLNCRLSELQENDASYYNAVSKVKRQKTSFNYKEDNLSTRKLFYFVQLKICNLSSKL